MERNGPVLYFSLNEQDAFNVPDTLGIPLALTTAEVFSNTAARVEARAAQDLANDDMNTDAQRRSRRAADLAGFAKAIFDLCPDEHLYKIMRQGRR